MWRHRWRQTPESPAFSGLPDSLSSLPPDTAAWFTVCLARLDLLQTGERPSSYRQTCQPQNAEPTTDASTCSLSPSEAARAPQ